MTSLWTTSDMAAAMRADKSGALPQATAGISIDSRNLGRGDAFFAIQGDARDGHDFVEAALKAGAGLAIEADVTRDAFETWIEPDIARIEAATDRALAAAAIPAQEIDRVFLTGGTSLIPRIRRMFTQRFGEDRIASGGELTSIAHGLALIGQQEDLGAWAA